MFFYLSLCLDTLLVLLRLPWGHLPRKKYLVSYSCCLTFSTVAYSFSHLDFGMDVNLIVSFLLHMHV